MTGTVQCDCLGSKEGSKWLSLRVRKITKGWEKAEGGTESVAKEKVFKIINRMSKKNNLLKIVLIFTENRFLSHHIFWSSLPLFLKGIFLYNRRQD